MTFSSKKFIFQNKAETLYKLSKVLTNSTIPEFMHFCVSEWNDSSKSVLKQIIRKFKCGKLAVRSSASCEDIETFSMAGRFYSVLNLDANDHVALVGGIKKVIESFEKSADSCSTTENKFIVQEMVESVSMSGVLFTQDLNTGAPYYVINYDDESGRTDTVTAGIQYSNRTLYVARKHVKELRSDRFVALLKAVEEIEKITGHDSLDIEFAIDTSSQVYLLQARPITTWNNWNRGISLAVEDSIKRIKLFVEEKMRPLPNIYGSRSIFGQMPDWNPSEMIGSSPRPLALSLYRKIITDSAWRRGRKLMGYAEPPGAPLMSSLCGKPYIDVRFSFHSFLPAGLSPVISNKLVNAYLNRLAENRDLHDAIEFEIALTAYTPDFNEKLDTFYPHLLNDREREELSKALFELTNNLIHGRVAPIDSELIKINHLEEIRKSLVDQLSCTEIYTASALLDACIDYGTIPFSILARHAFIGKSFLNSMLNHGVLSRTEAMQFENSIKTVAGEFVEDLDKYASGELDKIDFMHKYGHLRAGTYNIMALRYEQRPDIISRPQLENNYINKKEDFRLSDIQENEMRMILAGAGFEIEPIELLEYIKNSVVAREYSKFVFTRTLSDAIECVSSWGEKMGLNREELSYIPIEAILESRVVAQGRDVESYLRRKSQLESDNHKIALALHLPHIIDSPEDIAIVPLLLHKPNFITQKNVSGEIVLLDSNDKDTPNLTNKIVLIEGADPGYDWIFSRNVVGLITKYGGANSHMAIRCAEFSIPAAIGCGEQIFDRVQRFNHLELNCSENIIHPVDV